METTFVWVGEYIWNDMGRKWYKNLAIFGHGGEKAAYG